MPAAKNTKTNNRKKDMVVTAMHQPKNIFTELLNCASNSENSSVEEKVDNATIGIVLEECNQNFFRTTIRREQKQKENALFLGVYVGLLVGFFVARSLYTGY